MSIPDEPAGTFDRAAASNGESGPHNWKGSVMLRRIAILAAAVLAVWDLSGCATAGPGQSGDRSGGSAPAAMPVSPPGVSAGLPSEPSATGRCASGPPLVTVDPGR